VTGADATTAELRGELHGALAGVLAPGTEIAYVNFPNMGNLGDSAIYAGARRALADVDARVVLACEPRAYRRQIVRSAVGERGTIVIHGGANFGDLYRKQPQQTVRRRLLRDFPKARVIQLPQTIYFQDPERSQRFIDLCRGHADLTIMARDRVSVERAGALRLDTTLAPDLAFGLGSISRPSEAEAPTAWIVREDVERTHEPGAVDPSARDWPTGAEQRGGGTGAGLRRDLALLRGLNRVRDRAPARLRLPIARAAARRYGRVADRRVELAMAMIARGEVLVSDRFHGHLLACLMGIPNVLLDNSYGKNRGLFETWTGRYEISRFAGSPAEARELAESLRGAGRDRAA
jgi:exopolysaccharide biosynthesis predicted pyruvyltransferase EpsI